MTFESPPPATVNTERSTPSTAHKKMLLGLKILAGLLIIAAPALIANQFIDGVMSVAFFGVLAATFGWMEGGAKVGSVIVVSLSGLGLASVAFHEHTLILALILLALGVLYGYFASKGLGAAVLQLPILTPYFMMRPPPLFHDPPVVNAQYAFGIVVVMLGSGLWTMLVLRLVLGKRGLRREGVANRKVPIAYGTVLGLISAAVLLAGTATGLKSHWVWITLTLYLLADPVKLVQPKKLIGRALGTAAGFGIVSLLALLGASDQLLAACALPAIWLCIYSMAVKSPYWMYAMLLTIAVVLMNSAGLDTLLLDAERLGFTLLGTALSLAAALLMNLIFHHRFGVTATPESESP